MPRVAYNDAALTIWTGGDSLKLIEGLSTNKMTDLAKGEVRQTIFTTTSAKIIDIATVYHMGDFLAVQTHKSCLEQLLSQVLPKILDQDVNIRDVTEMNSFLIEYQLEYENVGHFTSNSGTTQAFIAHGLSFIVSTLDVVHQIDGSVEEFNEWRIQNLIPWIHHEISSKNHPLAVGLSNFVHPDKGCYVGQEVLARMISRKRQGKRLTRVVNGEVDEKFISTQGKTHSLAIVRQN